MVHHSINHNSGSIGRAPEVCRHAEVGVMPMVLSAAREGGSSGGAWGWAIDGVDECASVCSAWCRCACMVNHGGGSIGSAPEVCRHAEVGVMPMVLSAAGE